MKGIFVVGTDTGVGKTVVSAVLLAGAPDHVRYWKPVQTGGEDDTATVCRLAGLAPDRCMAPVYRLALPASPHFAAQAEGREVDLGPLLTQAYLTDPDHSYVVEGAGGLLVPFSRTLLQSDLLRALALPVLLAASTRLGTINHTLLTLYCLTSLGIPVAGVILVGAPDAAASSGISAHSPVPVLAEIPELQPLGREACRTWGEKLRAHTLFGRLLAC